MAKRRRNYDRQIVVRLDRELHDALERDARENGRTVAQTVRFRLQERLAQPATA